MRRCSALLVAMTALGCSEPERSTTTVRLEVSEQAPAYQSVPAPTDAWRGPDGRLERIPSLELVVPENTDVLSEHLMTLDGFGLRPAIELFVDGAIDAAALPSATSSTAEPLALVDVEPGSPDFGVALPIEWRWDAARSRIAGAVLPGVVLREGHRYAAVVTDALAGEDGLPLAPAAALDALRAGPPERWRSTGEALAALEATAYQDRGIVALAVFTTQHATGTLVAARSLCEDARAVPAPTLAFAAPELVFDDAAELDALLGTAALDDDGNERWGWSNPTGIAHAHVGVIATGMMTAARFTRDATDDGGPDDETFDLDESRVPRVIEAARAIPVTFVLPAAPPPLAGYPVAIFGHGLGASRHAVLTFAEPLTRAGFAVVAIDMNEHGSRQDPTDELNNTAALLSDFSGAARSPDGFGDKTGIVTLLELFEGFINLSAVRDSVRQSALDLSQLARLLRSDPDLAALAGPYGRTPRLDASRLAYLGESYGSLVGGVFAAIEPEVDLFVLDVPGGGILDLEIANAPVLYNMVVPLTRAVYSFEGPFDRFHPLVTLAQALIDPADPLSYAPHVLGDRFEVAGAALGPRHVVLLEVIDDELVPNVGSDALATAMGVPLLEPWAVNERALTTVSSPARANRDGQTAVMVQYAPAVHGSNWTSETGTVSYYPGGPRAEEPAFELLPEPITLSMPLYETFEQVVEVLETHRADDAPTVRSTEEPLADFDGDGEGDAEEIAAGGDPFDPGR